MTLVFPLAEPLTAACNTRNDRIDEFDGPMLGAYLRPAVRLGYAGLTQTQSSSGVQITEKGPHASVELGILYDAWLVPALSVGAGLHYRQIRFEGTGQVAASTLLDWEELLGFVYTQLGFGLPLFHSFAVL